MSRAPILLLLIAVSACAGRPGVPNDPGAAVPMGAVAARTDPAAVDEFRPDVAPVDTTGECAVQPSPTGSGRLVTMSFPDRATARAQIAVVVDKAGRAVQSSERRGLVVVPGRPGATPEERQRALAAANRATRSTTITLDFATGQAMLANTGGGRKDEMVIGRVPDVLARATLGRPGERVHNVLLRCLPER
jgi:hypothetical protein